MLARPRSVAAGRAVARGFHEARTMEHGSSEGVNVAFDGSSRPPTERRLPEVGSMKASKRAQFVTEVSCPDCQGVLRSESEGPHDVLRFVCRVGHAFALETLIASKRDRLEDTLWSAIILVGDIAELEERLARTPGTAPSLRRVARSRQAAAKLREIVEKHFP
jgi:hypothetical protein